MRIAFSTILPISFDDALKSAKSSFPEVNFSGISNRNQLYDLLNTLGLVLYVDVDYGNLYDEFQETERKLAMDIDKSLDDCGHVEPRIFFDDDDLTDDVFCATEDPEELRFPGVDPMEFADLIGQLDQISKESDGDLSNAKSLDDIDSASDLGKIVGCVREMERITAELRVLLDKENKIKNTMVNFEQLLYNYRVMEKYYQTKIDTLNNILGIFVPLLERQQELENVLIPTITARIDQRNSDLENYIAGLEAGTSRPTEEESVIINDIERLENQSAAYEAELDQIDIDIKLQKSNIYSFDNEQLQNGDLATRRKILLSNLSSLYGGTEGAFEKIAQFSSRVTLEESSSGSSESQPFKLKIEHSTIDEAGILGTQDLSFVNRDEFTEIVSFQNNQPTGILYNRLYNIWGDIDQFFTREERGLTSDSNYQDSSLKGTGAGNINGNFIKNLTDYEEFYTKFKLKHDDKTNSVRTTVIEPALASIQQDMIQFAVREIQLLLSFGKTFEDLPAESTVLQTVIDGVRRGGGVYIGKVKACKSVYEFIVSEHNKILLDIERKKTEYSSVSCASGDKDVGDDGSSGSDPLGLDMGNEDPVNPNPTKYCYWKKFAKFATSLNLLPVPGGGGFKYWPIGVVIPSPGGLIKIPLPIVWIPLAVISLPVGIFVIMIGQCGVCPSPFVFYVAADGSKKFIISLRPTQKFGSDASLGVLKTVGQGGIAVKKKMSELINDVKVESSDGSQLTPPGFRPVSSDDGVTVLEDVRDLLLKKISKLGKPNSAGLPANDANEDLKRNSLRSSILEHLQKLNVPDIKIPKETSILNPKPTPVSTIMDSLKNSSGLDLPEMSIPSDSVINLRDVLMTKLDEISVSTSPIPIPDRNDPDFNNRLELFGSTVKDSLRSIASIAASAINADTLGLMQVASGKISFLNAYKCGPTSPGFSIPPISSAVINGLSLINGLSQTAINSANNENLFNLLSAEGRSEVGPDNLKLLLLGIISNTVPNLSVPNISNVSIKDVLKSGSFSLASMQVPSLPDPTKPIQPAISIPGGTLKNRLIELVVHSIDSLDVNGLNFDAISDIDLKQLMIGIVEENLNSLDATVGPFVNIISKYKIAKDKSFAELLGLPKVDKDDSSVELVDSNLLIRAKDVLKKISLVPYPAVAIAPDTFKKLHPILVADDLPPWERFSLDNFLFVTFLDQWCSTGKKGGGFFENP